MPWPSADGRVLGVTAAGVPNRLDGKLNVVDSVGDGSGSCGSGKNNVSPQCVLF